MTQRKIQADETRKKIFVAARELFEKRGYVETTVDDIARRAGVAKGTFFLHFGTKDAVVTQLVAVQCRKALEARASGATPRERLRAAVMTLGEQAGYSRLLSRAVLAASLEKREISDRTSALFDELHQQMVRDARDAGAAEPELLARALMAAYLGAVMHFCSVVESPPLVELLAPLVDANLKEVSDAAQASPRRGSRRRVRRSP